MMRATSIAARPLNTEAQREAVLQLFAREPWQASREAVADKTNIKLQTICWRIRELLDAKTLKELPAKDGKHPLELVTIAAGRTPCYSEARPLGAGLTSSATTPAVNRRTGEDQAEGEYRVPAQSAPAAPEHAPRSPHCDGNLTDFPPREIASHGARSVVPYLPSHLSPTLVQAKIIVGDKQNAFYDIAREVIERGEQFRIFA